MTEDLSGMIAEAEEQILSQDGVQSIGIGQDEHGEEVIVIGITSSEDLPAQAEGEIESILPSGTKKRFDEVGEIQAEVVTQEGGRKKKHRPVVQGVSCGHPDVTAGTLGFMFKDGDGNRYVGSNNHVLAAVNKAEVGDPSLQPGTYDGGSVENSQFGTLAYYKQVEDGVSVDLAIAKAESGIENTVYGMDAPVSGVADSVSVGDTVIKSGRTTAISAETVNQVGASVRVNYGDVGVITIRECIITGDMSDGGDSGSAVWKEDGGGLYAAGRLFAGSSEITVHHSYENEIQILREEFDSDLTLLTEESDEAPTASVSLVLEKKDSTKGRIEATVMDSSEQPISEATVTATGEASREESTNSDGVAVFSSVPIGDYTVAAKKTGYNPNQTQIDGSDFQ